MDAMDEESFKLVMQLMQEEIAANENAAKSEKESKAGEGSGETDETKKKQEDLDLQLAMEIQNALDAQQPPKPVYAPPVPYGGGRYKPDHSEVKVPPSQEAIKRLIADLREVVNSKDPTIHVSPDPNDITHISALIIGPEGTPYEGGFFHFDMHFPHDYPWNPPKVHLETTDGGSVRFNPNLYACGKGKEDLLCSMCLSILGTWSGPSWTEIQTILSTLMSVQSLMNEKPYHNEPGHEVERHPRDVTDYNDCIEHETLRVAVIGMMENPTTPAFMSVMEESFLQNYDKYLGWIEKRREKDGRQMRDPFGESRGMFKYGSFVTRLQQLKETVEKRREEAKKQKEIDDQKLVEDSSDSDDDDSEGEEDDEEDKMVTSTTTTTTTATKPVPLLETTPGPEASTTPAAETAAMDIEVSAGSAPVGPAPTPSVATAAPVSGDGSVAGSAFLANSAPFIFDPQQSGVGSGGFGQAGAPNASEFADPDYLLALQLQAQLDGDAELAQQLQSEMQDGAGGAAAAAHATLSTYTPIKPPTLEELMSGYGGGASGRGASAGRHDHLSKSTAGAGDEDKDYDPSIVCLICKQSPLSYVVLPSCEQPHIYCYPCAEKRANMPVNPRYGHYNARQFRGRHNPGYGNKQSLTCVLCNAISPLDGPDGLKSLKRHRKRKREGARDGWCGEHKEEMSLYCMDDNQLICLLCAGTTHANHTYEALETAQSKLQPDAQRALRELETKWGKLESFVKEVKEKEDNLAVDSERKRKKAKEEIERLRKVLDEKEKEIDGAIASMHTQKQHSLTTKVAKAKAALEKIPGAISAVQSIVEEKSALQFLQKYEDGEQEARDLCNMPVPTIGKSWFSLPPFKVDHVEQLLKQTLKYQDMRHAGMYGGHPMGYGDEDDGYGQPDDDDDDEDDAEEVKQEEAEIKKDEAEEIVMNLEKIMTNATEGLSWPH